MPVTRIKRLFHVAIKRWLLFVVHHARPPEILHPREFLRTADRIAPLEYEETGIAQSLHRDNRVAIPGGSDSLRSSWWCAACQRSTSAWLVPDRIPDFEKQLGGLSDSEGMGSNLSLGYKSDYRISSWFFQVVVQRRVVPCPFLKATCSKVYLHPLLSTEYAHREALLCSQLCPQPARLLDGSFDGSMKGKPIDLGMW